MSWDIINPRGQPSGWNDGMLAPAGGRMLFVAGQTARDATGRVPRSGFAAQFRQTLVNVFEVLHAAGAGPGDIGRMTIYVTDLAAYHTARGELAGIWKDQMGSHYVATALVEVKGLVDENALIEIEATAVVHPQDRRLV
jgi:enamine deaminase RidA (YjgF/YER057c/UK114 family)